MIEKSGYRDDYLADKLKVSKKTIYNWKKGIGFPTFEKLYILAHVIGCKTDDLAIVEEENE